MWIGRRIPRRPHPRLLRVSLSLELIYQSTCFRYQVQKAISTTVTVASAM